MKIKKIIFSIVFVSLILANCSPVDSTDQNGLEVEDALGRIVRLDANPERIVIAGKQTPMLANFFYLFDSAGEKILAIENRTQRADRFLTVIDSEFESKLKLEKGAAAEQIAPLNPDAVILKTSMKESVGDLLEQIGITVIYVDFESIEQIYSDIRLIAELLKEKNRGEEIISYYEEIYLEISKAIEDLPNESVLLTEIIEDADGYAISVPAAGWLQTDLVRRAEGIPVWTDSQLGGGWTEVNFEQVSVWNPDYVFVINYQGNAPSITEALKMDELWMNLNAVNNGRLAAFPNDYISWDQPDPRWILGYSFLAHRLHPDAITAVNFNESIIEFYEFFYGLEEDFIRENIFPLIQ